MVLEANLLRVDELPARGDFPASWLVSVVELDTEVARVLAPLKPLSPVTLRLACRRVQVERGAAYKLRIVGVDKPAAA